LSEKTGGLQRLRPRFSRAQLGHQLYSGGCAPEADNDQECRYEWKIVGFPLEGEVRPGVISTGLASIDV
jgi:hypothetical protein